MCNNSRKQVYEFLVNDDFINYVINPSVDLHDEWDRFFALNPDLLQPALEARNILLNNSSALSSLSIFETEIIKKNILSAIHSK